MKISILRRIIQILILFIFIICNHFARNLLEGNLSSSIIFKTIHLSDPLAVLQIFLANLFIGTTAIFGALLVVLIYIFLLPRAFCSFVCPINLITDLAAFLREKFNIKESYLRLHSNFRFYLLAFVLIASAILKIPVFENVNYIAIFMRSMINFSVDIIFIVLSILVFEIFITKRGICSKICPLGAFWSLVGKFSIIRIFHNHDKCTKCNKCKVVCPEIDVLDLIGKNSGNLSKTCISCCRCIDVCGDDALKFNILNLGVKK